jgi:DNA repair exonuclease SbcCD nuclease subunit
MRNPSAAVDERLRAAPFDAFRNLQALCESQAPDFHLIAGGVFDLADRSVYAQLAFHDGLAAIASSGIPVYLAQGPEDPAAAWLPTIDWPEGVHVLGGRHDWFAITKDDETIAQYNHLYSHRSHHPVPRYNSHQFITVHNQNLVNTMIRDQANRHSY